MASNIKIKKLISKGVSIYNPASIEIGSEVKISQISSTNVKIYPGCRIFGSSTSISPGVELGAENPVTIKNCNIASNVKLKGGYFNNSVFMEGVTAGSGSHVRSGTILEEQSAIAHSVGLKQTILFPFVKIGSLVNFCDCFMSGGTSNTNHSEVGSSYVHFNYTPNQDKATPSLIGDVPRGVMLNQNPIFLGGQGGLVGPCCITYGTIIPAGFIQRKDQLEENRLVIPSFVTRGRSMKYSIGFYQSVNRQTINNIKYIANLLALMSWYRNIRSMFVHNNFDMFIFSALIRNLKFIIENRINNFKIFCEKLQKSSEIYSKELRGLNESSLLVQQKKELYQNGKNITEIVYQFMDEISVDSMINFKFISSISEQTKTQGSVYLDVIKKLNLDSVESGTRWLRSIVDKAFNKMLLLFPSIK